MLTGKARNAVGFITGSTDGRCRPTTFLVHRIRYQIACVLWLGLLGCTFTSDEGNGPGEFDIERYSADAAISWNEKVIAIAVAEDGLLTLKGVRTLSMMHVAMHDALNAVRPRYATYAYGGEATSAHPVAPDPLAAAAQAAYHVALDQYPEELDQLKGELDRWLNAVADGPSKNAGVELGHASATAILSQREHDGWNAEAEYVWQPPTPGVYAEFNEHSGTPEGFVFGAGWARATPFMLTAPDQFRAPPPPDIHSAAYTQAFNEVKELGRFESSMRTADQTHTAMWWKDFAENSHNRLARKLATDEQLNLWDATRMFALLNMSVFDAYVSVFDNKFFYNHWRPYTAIRVAENDGNPDTSPESAWNNLHKHTYAFPSYPSAHGTASAAAMTTLEHVLGDEYAFTMTTAEVDQAGPFSGKVPIEPATRSFDSFAEAAMECALSRVYLGIHFRYDSEEGFQLGRKIGEYARENFLKAASPVDD